MVSDQVCWSSGLHLKEDEFDLHVDAMARWLDRTCTCAEDRNDKQGAFLKLNKVWR